MQLYMSEARVSRRARRWAWANRPIDAIDNPVKRYLRNRQIWHGTDEAARRWIMGLRWIARPAI